MNHCQHIDLVDVVRDKVEARRSLTWAALAAIALAGGPVSAQELPVKRAVPGANTNTCPILRASPAPSLEASAQASQLGRDANQADILGDLERARDLLARATQLDQTSATLAYRYARVLEDLGEREAAIVQLCRVLDLSSDPEGFADAPERLETLLTGDAPDISEAALEAFQTGLRQVDSGNLEAAASSMSVAASEAPLWAEAVYNRGVLLARLGRRVEAAEALRRYLALRPGAADAITVSETIGELQTTSVPAGSRPSAPATLTLGILVPGMGHVYSGRPRAGLVVLAAAGGALAAGYLIQEVTTQCLTNETSFSDCPSDQVYFEERRRPYLAPALGVAAGITVVSAVEAFLKSRRARGVTPGEDSEAEARSALVTTPRVRARGGRLDVSVLRVTF